MRVLFVAPWVPSEVRPRSLGLLRILAEDNEVMFLGLARHAAEAQAATRLPVVEAHTVRNSRVASAARSLGALAGGESLQTAYADVPEFRDALLRLVRSWSPDVVHLNVFRTVHLLPALAEQRVVVDMDEFRSAYYAALATGSTSLAWRTISRIEAPRMRRAEDRLLASGPCLLVSSPDDVIGAKTRLVRTPCDYHSEHRGARRPVVLFVGRLHYRPNAEGIRWFCQTCWPAIHADHPDVVLRIVGESPPHSIRQLAGAGIEVLADVRDVRPLYHDAMIAIVPVPTGTGVQMKLVQALASGVPVVSFPGPLRRAGLRPGDGALAADSAPHWVARVTELLDDGSLRSRLASAGTAWAQIHHHSSHVREALLDAYATAGVVA